VIVQPQTVRHFAERIARRIPYGRRAWKWLGPHAASAAFVTSENTLEAYNAVYASDRLLNEYLSPSRNEFYEELATIFAALAPRRVIDVGCGTGHLLRFVVDRMTATPEKIVGVDHSEAGIRRARELLPSATFVVDDLYGLSLEEGEFDLVLCTEVLEHLTEPDRAVGVLRKICARDGRVAITVPDGAQDSWEGHVNFWDEHDLRAFLAPHGLARVDRIEGGRTLLAWLAPEDG
jgi:2-polyprenyl-3-methyl-5-hydroxy-6-metoxy-1,4-benzoquinol methylase